MPRHMMVFPGGDADLLTIVIQKIRHITKQYTVINLIMWSAFRMPCLLRLAARFQNFVKYFNLLPYDLLTFRRRRRFPSSLKFDSRLPKGRWPWIGWYCMTISGSG